MLVIGGGYAGVMAANRLTQRDDVTVTLINPRPDLVHRVRLHQLVGGSDDAVVAYEDVLADCVLSTDTVGRLLTDETLTSVDDARIIAVGDSAAPSGLPPRMSCLTATPLAARAADTVLSRLAGEQPESLHRSMYAQCISLGRSAGIYQFANRSDVAVRLYIDDGLGARIKEMVCTGIPKHLAGEAHKPGSFSLHRMPGGVAKRKQMLRAHRAGTPAAADRAA
ncbi:hypothetical protein STRAU_4276 [Streptomyces aurantiacus JA 4570]|uniref:FAD/NAD(P)-binding domain-containing protein n=1 Tax=Streptomyces aurantiacus JA 4570 TaxID=1286094 RepID=S3ZJ02_9ACTN|nr:hypothetical protein STRAU_4276 [Streptomyces aurantiacus JA 4570]